MLKEEKELRNWMRDASVSLPSDRPEGYAMVRALIRAVREDCAKVAIESTGNHEVGKIAAAAILGKRTKNANYTIRPAGTPLDFRGDPLEDEDEYAVVVPDAIRRKR